MDPAKCGTHQAESGPVGTTVCLCECAIALFAFKCTSIRSNWLLLLFPGIPWKTHSKLHPSAHFTAHRPQSRWLDSWANYNRTLQHRESNLISFLNSTNRKPLRREHELLNCAYFLFLSKKLAFACLNKALTQRSNFWRCFYPLCHGLCERRKERKDIQEVFGTC